MERVYHWNELLGAFDHALCRMVESVTGHECEPKNGGDHYFIEASYKEHKTPEFILALWDAIEGYCGQRLREIRDCPERACLFARIEFQKKLTSDIIYPEKSEDKDAFMLIDAWR